MGFPFRRNRALVAGTMTVALALVPFAPCLAASEESTQSADPSGTPAEKKDEAKAAPTPAPAQPADPAKVKESPTSKDGKKKDAKKPAAPAKPVDPKKAPAKDAAEAPSKKPKGQVNTVEDIYAEPDSQPATGAQERPKGT